MPDFSVAKYRTLIANLLEEEYHFQTLSDYLTSPLPRSVILRHDVDKRPGNSLEFAKLEHELGVQSVYYFRAKPVSWDEKIIRKIHQMGHEIGYHYEDLTTCRGDFSKAYTEFRVNLEKLRALAPVTTIAMHGSPTSRYDSRNLWEKYNYKSLGILGEPYFDVEFSNVLYLTDTGRRWDGTRSNVRDMVDNRLNLKLEENGVHIRTTNDLIRAAEGNQLPDVLMINTHPQRWHSTWAGWISELVSQNAKNVIKGSLKRFGYYD